MDKPPRICYKCNKRRARKKSRICEKCSASGARFTARQNLRRPGNYRKYVKDRCETCGFIPKHICQLDVDHKDGNKKNNDPANLATLCANCHRLKTQEAKDFLNGHEECVAPPGLPRAL